MLGWSAIAFNAPWVLWGLLLLPLLWILLRALPPAPVQRLFPAVGLLLGLEDETQTSAHAPWWLLVLRSLAIAAVLIGFAGPILNPQTQLDRGPDLLIVVDGAWAAAPEFQFQRDMLKADLRKAARAGQRVGVILATAPNPIAFQSAQAVVQEIETLQPRPYAPRWTQVNAQLEALRGLKFDTLWLSDGLDYDGARQDILQRLRAAGTVRLISAQTEILTLGELQYAAGQVSLSLRRSAHGSNRSVRILGIGRDPAGTRTVLLRETLNLIAGETDQEVKFKAPAEVLSRLERFEIEGQDHAAALYLLGNQIKRAEVALFGGPASAESLDLLDPLHFVQKALAPKVAFITGALEQVLLANPDLIIWADMLPLADPEPLLDWVKAGGTLVRFAGPRLAAANPAALREDPLLPVVLRQGGRRLGGAMSWEQPKAIEPFALDGPFSGLTLPPDIRVRAQVLAQPSPDLAARVLARLQDGTPLITRKEAGSGQIVFWHITANTDWSNLPLSGLFLDMLNRLNAARGWQDEVPLAAGTVWSPVQVLDGFGEIMDADYLPGIEAEQLQQRRFGALSPPGLYEFKGQLASHNLEPKPTDLAPMIWPDWVQKLDVTQQTRELSGWFLSLALIALAVDVLASLALSGRTIIAGAILATATLAHNPTTVHAQNRLPSDVTAASSTVTLGHVITGDSKLDLLAFQALDGLSRRMGERTSVEPGQPRGVNLDEDELALFPILYWLISPDQPALSAKAADKLNGFMQTGGVLFIDTRDADLGQITSQSRENQVLRRLARILDVPALEPVPEGHVLTRSFYLLQDFPGRFRNGPLWVAQSMASDAGESGLPFQVRNDGVTPILIGSNDWAAAWAVDRQGRALYPVGRGYIGERQREIAFRFGINLLMHVLTGNYKSDQVHVPALLERLGQ